MQMDNNFFDRLYRGRKFQARSDTQAADVPLRWQLEPMKKEATGSESVLATRSRYLLTIRDVLPKVDFEDHSIGSGRFVIVVHLGGERTTYLNDRQALRLTEPSVGFYYHGPGMRMRSCWYKGSNEKAVIIGSWLADIPSEFLNLLQDLPPFEGLGCTLSGQGWAQVPMRARIKRCADEITTIRLKQPLISSFLEAKTLELMCLALDALADSLQVAATADTVNEQLIRSIIPRIDDAISAPPSIQVICREVGLSPRDFSRHFQAVTKLSYQEYISSVRLARATSLIEMTSLPLKQIAYEVGYQHSSNLSTAIRKAHGLAPRELRRKERM